MAAPVPPGASGTRTVDGDGAALFAQPCFGTMEQQGMEPAALYDLTRQALAEGYRHVDMAEAYATGGHVGRALQDAGIPRSELWVTTKVTGMPAGDYAAVRARVDAMLKEARLQHVDLLLIHHPGPRAADLAGDPAALATESAWQWFAGNCKQAWANMSRLQAEGLATHVGVSNFYGGHIAKLAHHAGPLHGTAPVFANEVFIDALHGEAELVADMAARGIRALGYRPLAFMPTYALVDGLQDHLANLAHAKFGAASPQQLVQMWLLARGITPVVASKDAGRARANRRLPELPAALLEELAAMASLGPADEAGGTCATMVDMMGGCDEYAAAFASMGSAGRRK